MAVRKTPKIGLKQSVYNDLKKKLLNCYYPPGSVINELELTKIYNVSRTPIREAITQLEMDGYVKILPKKGIYVTEITIQDIVQIFRARIEIEPVTLRMAKPYLEMEKLLEFRNVLNENQHDIDKAYNLDMAMHLYFIDQCRNRYLIQMMHKVFDDNTRVVIATGQNEVKIHNAVMEHTRILDNLIADRDIDETCALMREHIETCRVAAIQYMNSETYRQHMLKVVNR